MATKDKGQSIGGMTRRAFVKTAAIAGAVAGSGFDFAYNAEKALAYENDPTNYKVTSTTCPYCSASCGQRVVTSVATGKVVDIYGDFESPMNSGGLCAKGAGSLQLVNNPRRIGAWASSDPKMVGGHHPVNDAFLASGSDVAYMRTGNGPWSQVPLDTAMNNIAAGLVAARGTLGANNQSKGVAFMGCSHMNNEPNYLYRKLIANFGTSNVEHQARI